MPSKRTSTSGSKAATSPAKKQRMTTAAVAPPVDPLYDAYAPVLKVLQDACTVTEAGCSAADLLCSALPYALRVMEGTEQRHPYQEKMLDVIAVQMSTIVTNRNEVVSVLEKEAADLEADKAQSTAVQEEIVARLAEKTKERDSAMDASKQQKAEVDEAQVALEVARKAVEASDSEKNNLEKARDDFAAGLTELWAPLKHSQIPGQQWRQRDRMLGRLAENMKLAQAEPSLLKALPVALKLKAEARSEFAQASLAHAEELYMKKVEVMKKIVEDFAVEVSARATAVEQAEVAGKVAQEAFDATMEADIAAQNAWVEVTSEESDQNSKMKAHGPASKKLQEQLTKVRAEVAHLCEVFDSFNALRPVDAVFKKVSGTGPVAAEVSVIKVAGVEAAVTEVAAGEGAPEAAVSN